MDIVRVVLMITQKILRLRTRLTYGPLSLRDPHPNFENVQIIRGVY